MFETLDSVVYALAFPLVLFYLVFGLDDFHIDLQAWLRSLFPRSLSDSDWEQMRAKPEQPLAIMVANWKEEGVISRMIHGNVSAIDYKNYVFFLGVYPNDIGTRDEALEVAKRYPEQVRVVINRQQGPTNKGQMLNEIVRSIRLHEQETGVTFAALLIHDSEDIIHPRSFRLYNWLLPEYDFIQVPVFPIAPGKTELVCGAYADEFTESHTKDMLVRAKLDGCIPSAGVGTAMSHRMIERYVTAQSGKLMDRPTLTEDYELGLTTREHGLKSTFACVTFTNRDGKTEFIATREFFPRRFRQAVRQRSRWTLGISFQGAENLGWAGTWIHRYFLFRDRKGPISNLLAITGWVFFLYSLGRMFQSSEFLAHFQESEVTVAGFYINAFFMTNRVFQRGIAGYRVYGYRLVALVPVRILVSNLINAMASLRATRDYVVNKIRGSAPAWTKTTHELPTDFSVH